jgi:hypothetical protein
MADEISILALGVSVLLLIVQYINQLERRHGEISQLRSDLITQFLLIQQRLISSRMHAETVRMELRTIKDSDSKYYAIERMPNFIERVKKVEDGLKEAINELENFDTKKQNTSKSLINLQKVRHEAKVLNEETSNNMTNYQK